MTNTESTTISRRRLVIREEAVREVAVSDARPHSDHHFAMAPNPGIFLAPNPGNKLQ
jgi:hypothetical protein